jgi:hypothetical protein
LSGLAEVKVKEVQRLATVYSGSKGRVSFIVLPHSSSEARQAANTEDNEVEEGEERRAIESSDDDGEEGGEHAQIGEEGAHRCSACKVNVELIGELDRRLSESGEQDSVDDRDDEGDEQREDPVEVGLFVVRASKQLLLSEMSIEPEVGVVCVDRGRDSSRLPNRFELITRSSS